MKLLKTLAAMFCFAGLTQAATTPDQLPFGELAKVYALAEVNTFVLQVYTQEEDSVDFHVNSTLVIGHVNSLEEVDEALKDVEFTFKVDNPLKEICIDGFLLDPSGKEIFISQRRARLEKTDVINGVPQYELPSWTTNFWWNLRQDIEVPVGSGLAVVTVFNKNGDHHNLRVENGKFILPAWIANDSDWNVVQLEFADGTIAKYDRFGRRLQRQLVDLELNQSWFEGIQSVDLLGKTLKSHYDYYQQWKIAPVLEFEVTQSGFVQFDVQDGGYDWLRPTHFYIGTMDDFRNKKVQMKRYGTSLPFEYLEKGTYYILFEFAQDGAKG